MAQFFFCIRLCMLPLMMVGCGLGPSMMRADRLTYNETVRDLQRLQQLGLVELSYGPEEVGLSSPISAERINLNDILKANADDYKLEYREDTKHPCDDLACRPMSLEKSLRYNDHK